MNIVPVVYPKSWEKVFESSLGELKEIEETLTEHMKKHGYDEVYPAMNNLYKALELTPLEKVKVVILGQDPYHQSCACGEHPRAQGLSFSIARCDKIPMSLKNIFQEIQNCDPNFKSPSHGDLTKWAEQGVLLLNTSLTVRPAEAGSHGIVWFGFIQKIITAIAEVRQKCIYVLWGREAEKIAFYLPNSTIQLVSPHPSGFSAHKGFFGCKHFSTINAHLVALGDDPIDWNI